jgi:GTPase SAR1 family protein
LAPPTIKLAVVGPKDSGKTAVAIQFVQGIFTKDYYPTVGANFVEILLTSQRTNTPGIFFTLTARK